MYGDIISSIPRRKLPAVQPHGPPACSACVNLNRERLRGDVPQGAAILYQNVDKGSQWSAPEDDGILYILIHIVHTHEYVPWITIRRLIVGFRARWRWMI